MVAFLFPGQGSQKLGMGLELSGRLPSAQEWWERAEATLGYDLRAVCWGSAEDELRDTRRAQPALLTVDVMYGEMAVAGGLSPEVVAGHSLGEFAALVAAGALDFEAALRLVQLRADLMAQAPPGAMAAVVGLKLEVVREVVEAACDQGMVVLANLNAPEQTVVSGTAAGVEAAMAGSRERGARMAVRLPVSGAFHSPLLQGAAAEMAAAIDAAPLRSARIPVFQNVSAQGATEAQELRINLRRQMTEPVRWSETIANMAAAGVTRWLEAGPGAVLTNLGKRMVPTGEWTRGEA